MNRITLSDFGGGMVQRVSPNDYKQGEWGYLSGFVPEDDRTLRSQWPIQSVGNYGDESARDWLKGGGTGTVDSSDVLAIYPLRSQFGVFIVAIKTNGTIWWTKAADDFEDYTTSNNCVWTKVGYDPATEKSYAENKGFSIYADYDNQPDIEIEENTDYRFICDLPFEVYKYIKRPQDHVLDTAPTPDTITVNGSHGGHTTATPAVEAANPVEGVTPTYPWYLDFTKDALPDPTQLDDNGDPTSFSEQGFAKSIVSAVLIHSRRYYRDGRLTRSKDYDTRQEVSNKASSGTTRTLTVPTGHGFVANNLINVDINDNKYDGFYKITSVTSTTIVYTATGSYTESVSVPEINRIVYKFHRNQTAVVAYVDPYTLTVKAATFPNFRRWPMYAVDASQSKSFSTEYRPMPSWVVQTNRTQASFPFIGKYPYATDQTSITAPNIDDTTGTSYESKSAYPKYGASFQPYTFLDKNKTQLPGRGLMPRAFAGTMFGNLIILGDIEWKEDSAKAILPDKRLVPTANKIGGSSEYSNFGLRDGNTEPHRGLFYYGAGESIDVHDPRNVLRASGTDTRIAGMHVINNRLITVTTAGGPTDGIISWAGNFNQIHPYDPGVTKNLNAVRRDLLLGGVGTADTEDWHNHGNPQTCLWPEFGRVAFIDKSGYVMTTNGESANALDDRYPFLGKPSAATVHDHVAAVGKYLFVYQNGYLLCYTVINGRAGWYILKRPEAWWTTRTEGAGYTLQYNVIKSMRGIGSELYFVVHSYWLDCDSSYEPLAGAEPILGASRVMRFAMNGPASERGRQDNEYLDSLDIVTPAMGVTNQSKKIFWRQGGINFYTETGCEIVGAGSIASYPFDNQEVVKYDVPGGFYTTPLPNMTTGYAPLYSTELKSYAEGYHNYELSAGIGPQRVMSLRFAFRGDVTIEGVNIFYTGEYDLLGDA